MQGVKIELNALDSHERIILLCVFLLKTFHFVPPRLIILSDLNGKQSLAFFSLESAAMEWIFFNRKQRKGGNRLNLVSFQP